MIFARIEIMNTKIVISNLTFEQCQQTESSSNIVEILKKKVIKNPTIKNNKIILSGESGTFTKLDMKLYAKYKIKINKECPIAIYLNEGDEYLPRNMYTHDDFLYYKEKIPDELDLKDYSYDYILISNDDSTFNIQCIKYACDYEHYPKVIKDIEEASPNLLNFYGKSVTGREFVEYNLKCAKSMADRLTLLVPFLKELNDAF